MQTRKSWLPRNFSLKTRFSLAVGLLILFTATVLTLASVLIVKRGLETVISERETSLIAQVARDLDQKLVLRQTALVRLASELGGKADVNPDPDFLQRRLDQYHAFGTLFSNLTIVDAEGEHVANMQNPGARNRINFSNRDYFVETLRSKGPVISRPLRSQISGRAVVVLTAPIFDANGDTRFILVGAIDLEAERFLKDLALGRIGKNGYFYVVSKEGTYLMHPDDSRLLKSVEDSAVRNAALEHALDGFEGTVHGTSENGADALLSFKTIERTGWVVGAVYPTSEAFAFAGDVGWNAAILAALLMLVIAPVAWLVIDRQLLPLMRLKDRMAMPRQPLQAKAVYPDDEIGDLWRAFDALMWDREHAESAMAESEKRLRLVADNVPAMVAYVDRDERFVFGNNRYETMFGVDATNLPGKTVCGVVGEAVYAVSKPYIDAALSGRQVRFERPVMRHGELQWDRVAYNPDIDGKGAVHGYFVLVDDITELKTAQLVLAQSEKRIRTITDNMPALIGYVDTELRYRFCNTAYATLSGVPIDQMVGRTVREVFGPVTYEAVGGHMAAALCGKRVSFERVDNASEKTKYLQCEYIPDVGADGQVNGFYSMVMDVTERKATELTLATQTRLLHNVTDNLPALVNFIDTQGRFQFVNRQHESWFGRPLQELHGIRVVSLLAPAEADVHEVAFAEALAGRTSKFEFRRPQNGDMRHYDATYIPQFEDGGTVVGVTGLVNDVTDAKRLEQQLSDLARFDALTGLPNRTQLGERIARAQVRSARAGTSMAVMYLDLDKFKSINDSFGHGGGDAVLIEFGRRLQTCVRQSDTVGRLAGDEFVVLLEGLQSDAQSAVVARKIIKAMEKPFDIDGVARIVTTSIGVATAINGIASADSLLKHADDALYRAKEKGRNRYAMTAVR